MSKTVPEGMSVMPMVGLYYCSLSAYMNIIIALVEELMG